MSGFGKRPINDALLYSGRKAFNIVYNGERRKERKSYGTVARLGDPGGHTMVVQLSTPGDPQARFSAERVLKQKLAEGWIRLDECPLRHSAHLNNRQVADELARLPADLQAPCDSDPRLFERIAGETHAMPSCPHVEWILADRRQRQADELNALNPDRIEQQRIEAERRELHAAQLEVVRHQLAETRAKSTTGKKKP